MNILGYEFKIAEGYPDDPQDNTVYVWKKRSGDYWQARCYFGWFSAEGCAMIDYPKSKYIVIINAAQDAIEARFREDVSKAYKELIGENYLSS